jgi:hypothetical protein
MVSVKPDFAFDYPVVGAGAWRSADSEDFCATVVLGNKWWDVNVPVAASLAPR